MKINYAVVYGLALSALPASSSLAQGKGGGNSGNNPGAGKGGGLDRPPAAAPALPVPDAPDSTPNRRADRPEDKPVVAPPGHAKGHAKGAKGERSASAAAHDLAGSMHDINRTAFAQRRELHESLDLRLKSSRDALKKIQTDAKDLRADARANFKTALDDVKSRENELTAALKASRNAGEAHWDSTRSALARAYQNHADAMARLEAIPRPPRL